MKNIPALLLAAAFLGMVTAGCTASKTISEDEKNKIYTVADAAGDHGFPAPYTHYLRGPGYIRMSLLFDTLVWKDKEGFTPALAQKWSFNEEENAYIFELQENATWHDGESFTARDVVFTFAYAEKHPYAWCDTSIIREAEMLDEYTVKLYLEEPHAPFLVNVAGTMPILPKHIYENVEEPREFKDREAAVGTGPFKLADYSREHGTYLLKAHQEYYLGPPRIDELRFLKIGEQLIPAAVKEGTAAAGPLPPEVVEEFQEEGFEVLASGHSSVVKLMFNHHNEPFSGKSFRQAVAHAIDRERLVEISRRGHASPGNPGFFPPDYPWYVPADQNYGHDPEKSREILKDLGYKGTEVELLIKKAQARDAELIKADLEEAGLRVTVRSLEDKTVDSRVQEWNFEMALIGHGGLGGDPEYISELVAFRDHFNSSRYLENEKLIALLKEQVRLMEEKKRQAALEKIQEIHAEELPSLPLYYPQSYWAHDGTIDLYYTPGGIALGVPIPLNKMSFVR